ncbi:CD166 antigen-like isoform X2 [Narcine bancroftii]|uniref:CD166 antigen-like isoform X2 n=1 Tax=Narcine bancroftii TaxID=1343680 RepID=UPI0038313B59
MDPAPALICGLISVLVNFIAAQNQSEAASLELLASFGEELQVPCIVLRQNNIQNIQWLQKTSSEQQWKEVTELLRVGERFKVLENGTLVILSVRVEDEGQFKCQVVKNGSKDHFVTRVAVFKHPTKPVLEPRFLTFTAGTLSEVGTCRSSDAYPISDILWYKSGREVVANGNDTLIKIHIIKNQNTNLYTTVSTLHYKLSKRDTNAEFVCEAVHPSHGESEVLRSRSIHVDVHYDLEQVVIKMEPSCDVLKEGETVNLHCVADTNPPPISYLWEKDGKRLGTSAHYTIESVSKREEGVYRCSIMDFNFNLRSAVRMVRVEGANNNELEGGRGLYLAAENNSRAHLGGNKKRLNKAGMVIGIIATLTLVIFFMFIAYYMSYYRKEKEKKPLEDLEERTAMDVETAPSATEKAEGEV